MLILTQGSLDLGHLPNQPPSADSVFTTTWSKWKNTPSRHKKGEWGKCQIVNNIKVPI